MRISRTAANLGVLEPVPADRERAGVQSYRYSLAGSVDYLFAFATAHGVWQVGSWFSDAKFLFCASSYGEKPDCFVMCDGSYLGLSGRRILAAREPLKYAEFFSDGDRQRFRCSNADVVDVDPLTPAAMHVPMPAAI